MQLLDTDVLIDVQRGHPPALAWFGGLTELPSVPGFVVMELLQDAQNARQVQAALKLVAPLPIVWPTETDCARPRVVELHGSAFVTGLGIAGLHDFHMCGRTIRRVMYV